MHRESNILELKTRTSLNESSKHTLYRNRSDDLTTSRFASCLFKCFRESVCDQTLWYGRDTDCSEYDEKAHNTTPQCVIDQRKVSGQMNHGVLQCIRGISISKCLCRIVTVRTVNEIVQLAEIQKCSEDAPVFERWCSSFRNI